MRILTWEVLNIFHVQIFYVNIRRVMITIKHTRAMMKLYAKHPLMRCLPETLRALMGEEIKATTLFTIIALTHIYLHKDASGEEDEYEETRKWICCYRLKREINYVILLLLRIIFIFLFLTNEWYWWWRIFECFWQKLNLKVTLWLH